VSQALATTSYALLGLLAFEGDDAGLTGYELKQRADSTLRFYWVAPAMSQVYTELARLARLEYVSGDDQRSARRTTRRYRITDSGRTALRRWLATARPEFPVLKHPIALRLLMGHLADADTMRAMLEQYVADLVARRAELEAVRTSLGDIPAFRYSAMVADWGLHYYDTERAMVEDLVARLR
jgi:DNA-binding PadR family transcriptional regulator